jgi:DNA-binding winged helix-turn-helix (wHTH) protein
MTDERDGSALTPQSPQRRVRFGPYEADLYTQEIWKCGIRLKLGGQPFHVLAMLLARPGDLVTREELQKQLWAEDTFFDANHGLNAAVNKLRETLNDVAKHPKYIETLPRRGYRFIGLIEPHELLQPTPKDEQLVATMDPAHAEVQRRDPVSLRNASHWGRSMPLLAIYLMVFAAFALLILSKKPSSRTAQLEHGPVNQRIAADERPQEAIAAMEEEAKLSALEKPRHPVPRATPAVLSKGSVQTTAPVFKTIISGGSGNAAPQISPDGSRIAFMSNRSGPWQIWVSDLDGSNPVQLSHTDSAGTPRWSPDGRSVAFDAPAEDGTSIFVVAADGETPARRLVEGRVPSFSRDGKWVYFASDDFGDSQVWKIPSSGGRAQQVTSNGGFAALESTDGYLYYSKSPGLNPEICRIPNAGGQENCSLARLRPRTWSSWAVTSDGILFAEDVPHNGSNLSVYEPGKHQVRDLVSLQSAPVWIGASMDGKKAIVNDSAEQQISLVENLR